MPYTIDSCNVDIAYVAAALQVEYKDCKKSGKSY